MNRRLTRKVRIGDRFVGGDAPILVQSMTNTKTEDAESTIRQILRLEEEGCEIIRCTVPTEEAALSLRKIKSAIHIPLVADIHFDYRLAIRAMEEGADGIRINPGNIGGKDRLQKVVSVAKEREIPIRVGVNSGSLEPAIRRKYGGVTPEGLVESALKALQEVEELGHRDLVLSMKASDVMLSVQAHEVLGDRTDVPLHLGITEAGTLEDAILKSSIGLALILAQGRGDTIRVSITGDPVDEIRIGKKILSELNLREKGLEIISCPTCGRTEIGLIALAEAVKERLHPYRNLPLKVAVMGCVVNGPGEARDADLGIAGGVGNGLIFAKGKLLHRVPEEELLSCLEDEVKKLLKERGL